MGSLYRVFHIILHQEQGCCELVFGFLGSLKAFFFPRTGHKLHSGTTFLTYHYISYWFTISKEECKNLTIKKNWRIFKPWLYPIANLYYPWGPPLLYLIKQFPLALAPHLFVLIACLTDPHVAPAAAQETVGLEDSETHLDFIPSAILEGVMAFSNIDKFYWDTL